MRPLHKKSLAALTMVITPVLAVLLTNGSALAAYAYNPSDLISDGIFSNVNSMGGDANTAVNNIQTFLNNENSGIKNLTDTESCNPTTPPTSSTYPYTYSYMYYQHCGQRESAAEIIYEAGRAYGINPQAIMATMQKEQSLITDPSPSSSQINCAMGYNSCSGFVGFFNQVDNGAWQFRTYIELMNGRNWWGYAPNSYPCRNSSTLYSTGLYPGSSVTFNDPGGTAETVTLDSSATAALYCYTPYVGPYSTTGYSGSYNFVQSFEQWWGSTVYAFAAEVNVNTYSDAAMTQPLSLSGSLPSGTKIYIKVSALNSGGNTWSNAWTHVATIDPQDRNSVFQDSSWLWNNRAAGLMESSVGSNQTGTFEYSMTTPNTDGEYHEDFGLIADNQPWGWMQDSATFGFDIHVSNPFNGIVTGAGTYSDSNYTMPIDAREMGYGQKIYVRAKIKNTGTQTWSNSYTNMATVGPQDRTSPFRDSSWSTFDRPTAMLESSVAPGQTGTFDFSITAPSISGNYWESYGLVADGQASGWMPGVIFGFPVRVVPSPLNAVFPDLKLYPGQSILSSNGSYTLTMQTDGNLVINTPRGPIWGSGTNGHSIAYLYMQGDGNLVMYGTDGRPFWASNTPNNGASSLVMQTDGNLVIYNSNNSPVWSTGTNQNIMNTPSTLTTGTRLTPGSDIMSPNGNYRAVMQSDGNFVIYSRAHALWGTSTDGKGVAFIGVQSDGNVVIYSSSLHPLWASSTNGHNGSTLVMQDDGNLVIYDANNHPVWGSGTNGKW